jgi:aminoglycoside phosphotransferase (APT) family kinase protein
LDGFAEHPHPALELAFRWLERTRPEPSARALVHGDFRLGNLIVDAEGLRGVIDWELASIGDPMQDLGWLCVRSWRFGGVHPVGGFGTREELFAAYEQRSGRAVNAETVRWWEVFGNVRWGVICIVQAMRHLSGNEPSVELAAIGRRVAEVEHDVMALLP